jgi:hypothetical protein
MPDEGKYCPICGGVVPEGPGIRTVLIDGKATGIDQLDRILDDVIALGLTREEEIREELLTRVKAFNYIPTKKTDTYADALMVEYRRVSARRK